MAKAKTKEEARDQDRASERTLKCNQQGVQSNGGTLFGHLTALLFGQRFGKPGVDQDEIDEGNVPRRQRQGQRNPTG